MFRSTTVVEIFILILRLYHCFKSSDFVPPGSQIYFVFLQNSVEILKRKISNFRFWRIDEKLE